MTSDLQAIAIEQRWCQSCPSGNLPTAGPVPWLGGPVMMRPPGWRELRRKTCVCGNLHRAGALGHVFAYTAPDLRRSRKAFRIRVIDGGSSFRGRHPRGPDALARLHVDTSRSPSATAAEVVPGLVEFEWRSPA